MKTRGMWAAWVGIAVLAVMAARSGATVIWHEDYETTNTTATGANITSTVIADPLSSGQGNVLQVSDTGAAGTATQWGELRKAPSSTAWPLPAGAVPGTDPFSLTLRYMIPSGTVGGTEDNLLVIVRWINGTTDNANRRATTTTLSFNNPAQTPRDTWMTGSVSGTVPATDLVGNPIDHAIAIISWADVQSGGANNPAGVFGYVDDVHWDIVPEPASAFLLMTGGLALAVLRRRRCG